MFCVNILAMKNTFMAILLLGTLSACGSLPTLPWLQTPSVITSPTVRPAIPAQSTPVVPPPEQQLFDEAKRLSAEVSRGALSRTAVADRLDEMRIRLVGRNAVDDDVFRVYRQVARNRDAGKISSAGAQQQMQARLIHWRDQWPKLSTKPAKPAFTLFMLNLYGMPTLGE